MKVTQQLIADAAGLSIATVSRALAGHPGIPVDTRRKVEQVARRLGYKGPKNRTRARHVATVGVLVAGGAGQIAHEVLSGITEAAGAEGLAVSVHMVSGVDVQSLQAQVGNWALLAAGGLCGVIAVGDWADEILPNVLGTLPVVVMGSGEGTEMIVPDFAFAASALHDWLWDLGHRRIGVVVNRNLSRVQSAMVGGIRFAASERGVESPEVCFNNETSALRKATLTGVTAWLCESSDVADGVRAMLAESKLHAPVDLSLAVVRSYSVQGSGYAGISFPWRGMGALAFGRLQIRMSTSIELPNAVSLVKGVVTAGATSGPPPGAAG